jgi:hypothetical protein
MTFRSAPAPRVGALTAEFTGQDGTTYYFRGRARGSAGQVEAFREAADAKTTVDIQPPTASLVSLPVYTAQVSVPITWTGADLVSGIASYDVQTRSVSLAGAADSGWTDWLTSTVLTRTVFVGQDGNIYGFRVRALDAAGNAGAFSEEAAANAAFLLSLEPAPQISLTVASRVLGWPGQVPGYAVAATPTPIPTPTATAIPATPVPSPTPAVTPAVEAARAQPAGTPTPGQPPVEEASASAAVGVWEYALAFLALIGSFLVRRWAGQRAQRRGQV